MTTPSRSGVFDVATDPRVVKFTESVSFDRRLYTYDIEGSIAHAQMLAKTGLITEVDCQKIVQSLEDIRHEIEQGRFIFSKENEDIHMAIEAALIDRLGDVGRKLHTARSRNDQVSTDLRMWTRDAVDNIDLQLHNLQWAFLKRTDQDVDVIVPAYTHLQRAQPVLAAHYWLAYIEKLQRDRERLESLKARLNVLPLGTGAVAGTSLPIDREMVRQQLGFDQIACNSMDASSDRDFVLDFSYTLAVIAEHISGWAEEWILWSTHEFGYLCLPREFCTCSSMMPQKINPDVLELIRGKTSRVIGNLTSLLMLVKGLPLAYNRDLQEDKPPLFDSFDTVQGCLDLAIPIVTDSQWNLDNVRAKLEGGYLDATTLMEYMVKLGIPQRTAHHAVGTLVGKAMEQQVPLSELELHDMQSICAELDDNVYDVLGVENALKTFCSLGSTAPDEVVKQIAAWQGRLGGPK